MSYTLKTHKTVDPSALTCSVSVCELDVPISETVVIESWHQSLPTRVSARISLRLSTVLSSLDLKPDAKLGVFISARSEAGRKMVSQPEIVADNGAECILLVEPHQLAGKMTIDVNLFCQDSGSEAGQFAPKPLDIVSSWEFKCELEGDLPRGAIEELDFDGDHKNALWQITKALPSEPEDWRFADLSSCIRITLNSKLYRTIGDQPAYSLALAGDFVWAILEASLTDMSTLEFVLENAAGECGTLVSTCASAVRSVFGTDDLSDIFFKFERQPSLMKSKAQSVSSSILGDLNG